MAWWIPLLKAVGVYAASSGTKSGSSIGQIINAGINSAKTAQGNKANNNPASTH